MTSPITPPPDTRNATEYESSDVDIRAILWLAAGALGAVTAVCIGLWLLLTSLRAEAQRRQPALSPLADTLQTPPAPRLQGAPSLYYQKFRAQEDKQLSSYGWADRERSVVHIPIEQAMAIIAERGEPNVKSEVKDQTPATEDQKKNGAGANTQDAKTDRDQLTSAPPEGAARSSPPPRPVRSDSPVSPRTLVQEVGLDQRLGAGIPLDLPFRDEQGQGVRLGQLFGQRPIILSLVYFRCPMLCTQVLNGVLRSSQAMSLTIGEDYDIISVSIDPRETPEMAAAKKQQYVARYHRDGAANGWHFLTGEQNAIDELASAIGYRYQYEPKSDQFAHPSGIVVLTPDGRVSRYFYGIDYPPGDLRLGLVESSQGRIGTAVDQILLLCFHYDPATGRYGLVIARVIQLAGAATVLVLGTFLWSMYRLERRRSAGLAAEQRRLSPAGAGPPAS